MPERKKLWEWIPWWGFLFLIAGWGFILAPVCFGGFVPGNSGDSRFNLYVLEHFYRWLAGLDESLINAPFFYPYPATIGFSDPHTLTGFLYAGLRFAGWKTTDALCGWFVLGNLLNFLAAYWVFRKFGLKDLGAGLGAFLYAFSLPSTFQFNHIQLAWRCAVPLGIFCLQYYLEKRRLVLLGATVLFLTIQTAMSFYLGLFLLLLMGAWITGWVVGQSRGEGVRVAYLTRNFLPVSWNGNEIFLFMLLSVTAMVLLFWGVLPNLEASRLYGFKRGWGEIAAGLPLPSGYLLAFHSNIWWRDHARLPDLPMWWEQNLFPGSMAIVANVLSFFRFGGSRMPMVIQARTALLLLLVLTVSVGGLSVYMFLSRFPGFDAIRSVSRIILVLMFPASWIAGAWVDRMRESGRNQLWLRWVALGVVIFTLWEAGDVIRIRDQAAEWEGRLANLRGKVYEATNKAPVTNRGLLVLLHFGADVGRWNAFEDEIDAMLLSQEMGLATLNGYSGNLPHGWKRMNNAEDILENIAAANLFRQRHGLKEIPIRAEDLILIGEGAVDRAQLAEGLRVLKSKSADTSVQN